MRPSVVGNRPKPKENINVPANPVQAKIDGITGTPIHVKEQIKSTPKFSIGVRAGSAHVKGIASDKGSTQPR